LLNYNYVLFVNNIIKMKKDIWLSIVKKKIRKRYIGAKYVIKVSNVHLNVKFTQSKSILKRGLMSVKSAKKNLNRNIICKIIKQCMRVLNIDVKFVQKSSINFIPLTHI
jgi:hypothetical protein